MFDQSLLQSGYDIELLISERGFQYALLALLDTRAIGAQVPIGDGRTLTIHPPPRTDRLYPVYPMVTLPNPVEDSFMVVFLQSHPSDADLSVSLQVDVDLVSLELVLLATVRLSSDVPQSPVLAFTVVDIDGSLVGFAELGGISKEELLKRIKAVADRTIPLSLAGGGQALSNLALRFHPPDDAHAPALGIYASFRLRNGPEPYSHSAPHGSLTVACNFLPVGQDIAFGFPGVVYDALAHDIFFRMGEEFPEGSGSYRYVVLSNPSDQNSDVMVRIEKASVTSDDNKLRITIEGEYFLDFLPDPDFTFSITIAPKIGDDGLLTWENPDVDVDLSLLADALGWLIIGLATIATGGSGFLPSVLGVKVGQELIVEPLVNGVIGTRAIGVGDASVLDALPARITIDRRRWDPLYWTLHQVAGKVTEVAINDRGFAFTGVAILSRQPEPTGDAVIRDVTRDPQQQISSLRYRASDIGDIASDLALDAPAAERWPYTRLDPEREPMLIDVTPHQAADRVRANRVQQTIPYVARKAEVVNNQIEHLKLISTREVKEEQARFLAPFRQQTRADIEATSGAVLREEMRTKRANELGREPTPDEVEDAYQYALDEQVAAKADEFAATELGPLVNPILEQLLRLELTPAECVDLVNRRIIEVVGKEPFHRLATVYMRDHPDADPRDNLLSLPRYHRRTSPV